MANFLFLCSLIYFYHFLNPIIFIIFLLFDIVFFILFLLFLKISYEQSYQILETQEENQRKDEIFFGILHELKTPLAIIKSQCEVTLLKERNIKRYIEMLQSNIKQVDTTAKTMKTLMDIKRQAAFKDKMDIKEVLQEIADDFKILSKKENKNLICEFECDGVSLEINKILLKTILQNFLQNAFKFSPTKSNVLFRAEVVGKSLTISIVDEGCGISDEKKGIFSAFKRKGDKEGIGLGLFLVEIIAKEINGKIKLENCKIRKGAIATLQLKLE